jgi:hypothetical protein
MSKYGVRTEYDYNDTHKRDCVTVWSGAFSLVYEATGFSLPRNDGYMLTTYNGDKIRVSCPCPRTESNYLEVDAAVCDAMVKAEGG